MADQIGSVALRIALDMTDLSSGLNAASTKLKSFGSDARTNLNEVAAGAAVAGAAAIAAGAAIVAGLYVKGSQAIDAQAKLAQQLKTTSASIATLSRAGDLGGVSIDKISAAGLKLDVALGKAAQGSKAQTEALDRLGLSASQVSALPLDQRILKINEAIKENIPSVQQAAVAAELFGAKNAAAISLLDSGTLARAAEETRLFGLAISEVDAAKVEQANDAFSTIGLVAQGVSQQVAIQLAPAVQAVSELLFDSAKEAGGFGNVAESVMDRVISAVSFVIDAIDGIKRVFSIVSDGIIIGVNKLLSYVAGNVAEILTVWDNIPGVDFSNQIESIKGFAAQADGVVAQARVNIDETLNRPLAGGVFRDMVAKAKAAAEETAQATVAARQAISGPSGEATGGGAATVDKAKEQADAAELERLRTSILTQQEVRDEKYVSDLAALALFLENKKITEDQYNALTLGTAQKHAAELLAVAQQKADKQKSIDEAEAAHRKQVLGNALSSLTSLMNSESRKMFEVGKAAAISQAIINTFQAATGSYSALSSIPIIGPALGAAAAGAALVSGFAQVQNIRKQSFGKGGGGGGGAYSNTQQVNANNTPVSSGGGGSGQTINVVFNPVDPSSLVSGNQINEIARKLGDYSKDGGKFVFN